MRVFWDRKIGAQRGNIPAGVKAAHMAAVRRPVAADGVADSRMPLPQPFV
jgi:hypothetical protein